MGMFSYECTACGGHDQFDWQDGCVIKIGSIHVKGIYDGYGRVQVSVSGRDEAVIAMPGCHAWLADSPEILLGTDIYCNGDGTEEPKGKGKKSSSSSSKKKKNSKKSSTSNSSSSYDDLDQQKMIKDMAKQRMKMLQAFMGGMGSADEDPRYCVPTDPKFEVLDELTEEILATLPTVADKKKKSTKKRKKKDEPSSSTTTTSSTTTPSTTSKKPAAAIVPVAAAKDSKKKKAKA